jgi:hypothetical protein
MIIRYNLFVFVGKSECGWLHATYKENSLKFNDAWCTSLAPIMQDVVLI